jgi:uncharacterized peroxidase-related enzyme
MHVSFGSQPAREGDHQSMNLPSAYLDDLQHIVDYLPPKHQSLSITWPPSPAHFAPVLRRITMSRINAISLDTATDTTRPVLEGVKKKIGFLPNLFSTLAKAPVALDTYVQASAILGKTSLSAQQKEAVYLATSQVNGCDYCLAAHTLFAGKAGLSAEDIVAARHGELNAYAALARQLVETRGHLNDEQIAAARAAGIDDVKIIEVIALVAVQTLTNYLNNTALTDIDFPAIDA